MKKSENKFERCRVTGPAAAVPRRARPDVRRGAGVPPFASPVTRHDFEFTVGRESIRRLTFYGMAATLLFLLLPFGVVHAATQPSPTTVPPPLVNVYSTVISNNEIFYLGGTATQGNATVVVYVQSDDGGVMTRDVATDDQGAWFYTHGTFLKRGVYRVWTQLRVGESLSPPSSQLRIEVAPAAFQFGSHRLSFETFYLIVTALLLLAIILLAWFNIHMWRRVQGKKRRLDKEISEAEDAVKRGFAVLHRDITAELESVRALKGSRELMAREKEREEKLLKDLGLVETYIEREVADIEGVLQT